MTVILNHYKNLLEKVQKIIQKTEAEINAECVFIGATIIAIGEGVYRNDEQRESAEHRISLGVRLPSRRRKGALR